MTHYKGEGGGVVSHERRDPQLLPLNNILLNGYSVSTG